MFLENRDTKNNPGTQGGHEELIPAAVTDTGCERELNEDRYAVIESRSGLLWIVCDGMGGEAGGELAAQLAIDAMRRNLENLPPRAPEEALRSAILEANRIIVLRRQNQAFAGMGTTVVGAMFADGEVVLGHVGDSRAYLIRDGGIEQLTTDHTFVQGLVDRGEIRAEEALSHPQAHILTRAIGSEPALEVEISKFWLWEPSEEDPVDYLVLCSDGLYSLIGDGEFANIVTQETPQRACVNLVELAKERGGFDNITLAVIPLAGQLRTEPPPNYRGREPVAALREPVPQTPSMSLFRFVMIVFVLSALSALVTILFMAVSVTG